MAFPTTSVIDTFTYSNGALSTVSGGVWASPIGFDFNVSGGAIFPIIATAGFVTNATIGNITNCEAYITITQLPGSTESATMLWLDGSGNGYSFGYVHGAPGFFQFSEVAGYGATTMGATVSITMAVGDSLGMSITISGTTTIEGWYNSGGGGWVSQGTRNDGTYTSARRIGIAGTGTSVGMDNFGGGTIVAGTTSFIPSRPRLPYSILAR